MLSFYRHFVLLVLILTSPQWSLGTTIHVNNRTGKNQNTGHSAQQAVQTFEKAISLLQTGDELLITNTGQPYRQSLIIQREIGTPDKPLLIHGNHAVLTGLVLLDPTQWTKQNDGIFAYPIPNMPTNYNPVLMLNGKVIPLAKNAASITQEQCYWQKNKLLYKPTSNTGITSLPLEASLIDSGVAILNSSYITIRNLISERHANDGFNIHGNSRGIIFENIIGRYNCDDGCSIHEDGDLRVRNAKFHHNQYGIEDVNASRSNYQGILVEHNQVGVHFMGGYHQLIDTTIRNNQTHQLEVSRGFTAAYLGKDNTPFIYDGFCLAKNLNITGGAHGILVVNRGKVALSNALIKDSEIGILLLQGGTLELRNSIVTQCTKSEIRTINSHFLGDYNLYFPGKLDVDQKRGISLAEFQNLTQSDKHSLIQDPKFISNSPILNSSPFNTNAITTGLTQSYGN